MSLFLELEKKQFIDNSIAEGKSKGSVVNYELSFRRFEEFLNREGITDLRNVDRKVAERFVAFILKLRHYRTKEKLSWSSHSRLIGGVKQLFRHLYLEEKILDNPFEGLEFKRGPKLLPRDILTEDEVVRLFEGLKDRYGLYGETVGELFYGTGVRAEELVRIKVKDINLNDHILFVKEGKGKKDRVIPIPFGVVQLCKRYKKVLKPKKFFFEGHYGNNISSNWVRVMLKQAAKDVGIKKRVTPHGIRHTFATHLLARGMDIRYIQALLGHEDIATTEIYTRITNDELIRVYRLSHPRA